MPYPYLEGQQFGTTPTLLTNYRADFSLRHHLSNAAMIYEYEFIGCQGCDGPPTYVRRFFTIGDIVSRNWVISPDYHNKRG